MSETEGNYSSPNDEESEEEDDDSNGEVPEFKVQSSQQIKIQNSNDISIGHKFHITVKVDKLVVPNRLQDNQDNSAALSGPLISTLFDNPQARNCITMDSTMNSIQKSEFQNASQEFFQNLNEFRNIPIILDATCSERTEKTQPCVISNYDSDETKSIGVPSILCVQQENLSAELGNNCESALPKQESLSTFEFEKWWQTLLTSENSHTKLNEKKTKLESNDKKDGIVSVYSIIDDFKEGVNNFIIITHENESIFTPEIDNKVNGGLFKKVGCKFYSDVGKLTGYQPLLVDHCNIEIEIKDKLLYVSIPFHLEKLKINFQNFSVGWSDFAFSGVTEIAVTENYLTLILTASTNNGFLEYDISTDVQLKHIQIEFRGNNTNEVMLNLVKNQFKSLFFNEYMKEITTLLKSIYNQSVRYVLQSNDVCAKLASYYDLW